MNQNPLAIACLLLAGGLFILFPPFHIRSVKALQASRAEARFNAGDFAQQFWNEKLLPDLGNADAAVEVLKAIAANPGKVRARFGRTVGVGDSYFLFVRGTGRVAAVSADGIDLSVAGPGNTVDVTIPLGPVFGNAVRDGTGLLNASAYPNSQQFNDLSGALDKIVETQVLPRLQRIAVVGKQIQFAGCVEVDDENQDLKPLKLAPISARAEGASQ